MRLSEGQEAQAKRYRWTKMETEARAQHQERVVWENCSFHDFVIRDWDRSDLGWLAGVLDGEGHFGIVRRRAGKKNGGGRVQLRDHYSCSVIVGSIDETMVLRCHEITGVGRITGAHKKNRKRKLHLWAVSGWDARAVALLVLDKLVVKRNQAELLLDDLNEQSWSALRDIHGRGDWYALKGGDRIDTA